MLKSQVMSYSTVTNDELAAVPLFPLPQIVLLPGAELPLYVFEPRYRDMANAVLEKSRREKSRALLVLVQLRPGFEEDYRGTPPIYDVGGLGEVIRSTCNPDGTFDLVLRALERVHITELGEPGPDSNRSYRCGQLRILHARPSPLGRDRASLGPLLSLVGQVTALLRNSEPTFELVLPTFDNPGLVVDRVADALLIDPSARQEAMELLDVGERLRFVMRRLSRLHLALSGSTPPEQMN